MLRSLGPSSSTRKTLCQVPKTGDPSSIQLTAHEVVQIEIGKAVTPQPYVFASGL